MVSVPGILLWASGAVRASRTSTHHFTAIQIRRFKSIPMSLSGSRGGRPVRRSAEDAQLGLGSTSRLCSKVQAGV
jgi:hypothetical protein